jgi:hypothetical protein
MVLIFMKLEVKKPQIVVESVTSQSIQREGGDFSNASIELF